MIYFICIIHLHIFHGNIWTHNWPAPNVSGFIAQLVERRTGIARSRVQAPLKSWIFFRLLYAIAKICDHNYLTCEVFRISDPLNTFPRKNDHYNLTWEGFPNFGPSQHLSEEKRSLLFNLRGFPNFGPLNTYPRKNDHYYLTWEVFRISDPLNTYPRKKNDHYYLTWEVFRISDPLQHLFEEKRSLQSNSNGFRNFGPPQNLSNLYQLKTTQSVQTGERNAFYVLLF